MLLLYNDVMLIERSQAQKSAFRFTVYSLVFFSPSVSSVSTSRKKKTKATRRPRGAKLREDEEEQKEDARPFGPIRDAQADSASTVHDRLRSPDRNV